MQLIFHLKTVRLFNLGFQISSHFRKPPFEILKKKFDKDVCKCSFSLKNFVVSETSFPGDNKVSDEFPPKVALFKIRIRAFPAIEV